MEPPNFYAGAPLERAAHRRADRGWLRDRFRGPGARVLPAWRGRQLVAGERPPRVAWLRSVDLPEFLRDPEAAVYLGEADDESYFMVDASSLEDPSPLLSEGTRFEELRVVGPLLPRADAALLAFARGVNQWRDRQRHCGRCGSPVVPEAGGHALICADARCGLTHHPRTDPAVIMLVHDGEDRCLLAANHRHPRGTYSVLAGFVEPGESLEDAVRREVLEEVGLPVGEVGYRSSQPWPFPGSLMIGFHAEAPYGAPRVNPDELRAARWFRRDELREATACGELQLPRPDSIARRLVEEWLADDRDVAGRGAAQRQR